MLLLRPVLLVWLLVATFGASGCDAGDHGSTSSAAVGEGEAELRIVETPDFTIDGPGGEESPFHEIADILLLEDGRFVVADQTPRIVVMGPGGSFVRSFGGRGDGPGEFRRVGWLEGLKGDSIVAYDPVLRRASVFSLTGEFGRTVTPGLRPGGNRLPNLLGLFEDAEFLAAEPLLASPPDGSSGIVRANMIVSRHDSDGVFLDSLTVLPADERAIVQGVLVRMPFLRTTSVVVARDRFHVSTADQLEVLTYNRSGELIDTARENVAPRRVTEEVLQNVEVAEPLIPLLPTNLPAVSDLIPDPLGRLWVGPYDLGLEDETSSWVVFDSEGTVLQELQMPQRFRPIDVGEESVVGVWTDNLGVEHVRVYRLIETAQR